MIKSMWNAEGQKYEKLGSLKNFGIELKPVDSGLDLEDPAVLRLLRMPIEDLLRKSKDAKA